MVTKKKPGRPKLKAKERHTERETVSFTKTEMTRLKKHFKEWVTFQRTDKPTPSFAVFLREVLTTQSRRYVDY